MDVLDLSVVKPPSDDICTHDDYVSLPKPEGYLSAKQAKETGAGSLACPWQLAAQQGQRINISIIDFNPITDVTNCVPIAFITDIKSRENRTVCKPNERSQHVFSSKGNSVQIQIITSTTGTLNAEEFLLHYRGKKRYFSIIIPCISIYRFH